LPVHYAKFVSKKQTQLPESYDESREWVLSLQNSCNATDSATRGTLGSTHAARKHYTKASLSRRHVQGKRGCSRTMLPSVSALVQQVRRIKEGTSSCLRQNWSRGSSYHGQPAGFPTHPWPTRIRPLVTPPRSAPQVNLGRSAHGPKHEALHRQQQRRQCDQPLCRPPSPAPGVRPSVLLMWSAIACSSAPVLAGLVSAGVTLGEGVPLGAGVGLTRFSCGPCASADAALVRPAEFSHAPASSP